MIGRNVRLIRDARGASQEELAHLAGIHVTYLSGIENGRRNPTVLVLARIASGLQVEPERLLREE